MPHAVTAAGARAGDLVFAHGSGAVSRAIRIAERIRWSGGAGWNHVAWLDHQDATGRWVIGQAEAHGVTRDKPLESVAGPKGSYVIVSAPTAVDRDRLLEFLRGQVGTRYGFLTIASIVVTLLSPRFVNVMLPGTWICSAVVGEGLRYGGWLHNWPDLYQVAPAELWDALPAL